MISIVLSVHGSIHCACMEWTIYALRNKYGWTAYVGITKVPFARAAKHRKAFPRYRFVPLMTAKLRLDAVRIERELIREYQAQGQCIYNGAPHLRPPRPLGRPKLKPACREHKPSMPRGIIKDIERYRQFRGYK